MTTNTPILSIPEVAPTQNSKEATINTGFAILEAACNAAKAQDGSAGSFTVSVNDWTRYFMQRVSGQTGAITVTVPATARFCIFVNDGAFDITIHISASAGADLIIPAGKLVLVQCDGTDVSAVSSGLSMLAQMSDVDLTGLADGQMLAWDAGASQFVFVDPPQSAALAVSAQTDDYALALADANSLIEVDKATAVVVTIPFHTTADFAIGDQINFAQAGAGQLTLATDDGVDLLFPSNVQAATRAQHSMITLVKTAADTWRLAGDLAAA